MPHCTEWTLYLECLFEVIFAVPKNVCKIIALYKAESKIWFSVTVTNVIYICVNKTSNVQFLAFSTYKPRSRRAQFAVILESRCSPNKRENSETVRLIKYILLFYFYSNLVSHFFFFI